MSKIKREKVVIESAYYNFEKRYEEAMVQFDDKKVISITVVSSKEENGMQQEEYLVFYEEVQEELDDVIEEGDLIYSHDFNTGARIYETVDKVVFEDGKNKCYSKVEDSSEYGWNPLDSVTLVAKKKDRKDI